ncbi:glycosyltransferase family 39 protein [Myxococcus sp. AB056]|uniref:glycosyltransferase family 39 protein n=1 Tax=Myxococcus sp. AB056 TaxID=2562792 RepID=UPI0011465553|nr:glycosyltransferase family 39 protein [Myxococcus sp. AB056]
MSPPSPASTGLSLKTCVALLGVAMAARLALVLGTDVYFDTAYYWQWARQLDWGYFDHPPLVAWHIALLGIEGTAMLCGVGTVAAVWRLARDVHGDAATAWRAAALWSVVPAGAVAGVWPTPDSPLLLFWTLALWALWRERWVLAGLAGGCALLSKYPAVLLGVAFLIATVRARRLPWGAWRTATLAGAFFAPVVFWNAGHDWVGFAFQLSHGLGRGWRSGWSTFGEFLAGQLALGGPVLFPLALVYGVRGPREHFLLRMAACVPLLFFGYASLRTRGEANWPSAAYLAACVGVAGMRPVWQRAAAFSGLAVVLVVGSHLLFPVLHFRRDRTLWRTHGWRVLRELATPQRLFPELTPDNVAAVYAPNYQLASQVAYYARRLTKTGAPARFSQYDLWADPAVTPGQDVLWVSEGGAEPPEELASRFTTVEGPVELFGDFRGRRLHTFQVWRLRAHKP